MATKVVSSCLAALGGAVLWYRHSLKMATKVEKQQNPSAMSANERFTHFASLQGKTLMSFEDFSRCMLYTSTGKEKPVSLSRLRELFHLIDADGDGTLDYSEFCAFMTLLSTVSENMEIAFRMFDPKSTGSIDYDAFKLMMGALSSDYSSLKSALNGGVAKYLFGENFDKVLNHAEFTDHIEKLRRLVRDAEFDQFDTARDGRISLSNLRKIFHLEPPDAESHPEEKAIKISREQYHRMVRVLLHADDIIRAMEIYVIGKTNMQRVLKLRRKAEFSAKEEQASPECDRNDFGRALRIVRADLSDHEIDVMFKLFDLDYSNTLDPDELKALVTQKDAFFAKHVPHFDQPDRNLVQQFVFCMKQH